VKFFISLTVQANAFTYFRPNAAESNLLTQIMNALSQIKSRFSVALSDLVEDPATPLSMIKPAGNPEHGDYQANCAMPLGKELGKAPRDIADDLVSKISVDDFCQSVEVAGPGFINLKLNDAWIKDNLTAYIVDFSSPNVAKPMHVGHIRSTVIGDALTKVLRFVGHKAISDNHLGDWGTQFGMIIYGYKNFVDKAAYDDQPVAELGRLYKYVRKLMDYHSAVAKLPESNAELEKAQSELSKVESLPEPADKSEKKKLKKELKRARNKVAELEDLILATQRR